MQRTEITEYDSDYEMLQHAFGNDYFICQRIKTKISLTQSQKIALIELIDERNHFEILAFVTKLRK